jgi:hypothetical protein
MKKSQKEGMYVGSDGTLRDDEKDNRPVDKSQDIPNGTEIVDVLILGDDDKFAHKTLAWRKLLSPNRGEVAVTKWFDDNDNTGEGVVVRVDSSSDKKMLYAKGKLEWDYKDEIYIFHSYNVNESKMKKSIKTESVFGIPTRKDKGFVEYEDLDEFEKLSKVLEKYDIKYTVDSDSYSLSSGYSGTLHFIPMKSEKAKAEPQAFSNDLKQVIFDIVGTGYEGDYSLPKEFDLPYKPDPKQTSIDTMKTFDKKFNTDHIGVLPDTEPFSQNESKMKRSKLKQMIKETYNNLLKEEDAEQLMNWLGLKDVKLRKNNSPNDSHVTVTTTSVPEYVETQLQNNQDWKNYYSKHQVIDAGGAFGDAQSIIVFHREDQPKLEDEPWTDPAGGTHYGDEDDPAAAYLNENESTTLKLKIKEKDGLHTFFKQWMKSEAGVNFSWDENGDEATIKFRKNASKKSIDDFKKAIGRSSKVSLNEINKMKKSQLRKIIRESINSMGIEPTGYYTDQGYKTEENPKDIEYWLKQIEGMSLGDARDYLGIEVGLPSSMTHKVLQQHNTDIVDTFDDFSDEENPFPSSRKGIDQLDKDDLYEGIGPLAGVILLGLTAAVLGGVAANVGGSLDSLTKYIHTGGPGKAVENLKQASISTWGSFLRKLPFIGSKLRKQDEENRLKAEIGAALQEFIKTGEGVEFIKSLMEDPEGKAILTRISNGSSNYARLYNIIRKYLNIMMNDQGGSGSREWQKVKKKFFALRKDIKGGEYKDTITPPDSDDGMEESIDREFHSISTTSSHPNWRDLSAEEIQDYIDANPNTLWGRSLSIAKMVLRDKKSEESINENKIKRSELKKLIKESYLKSLREEDEEDDADIEDEMEDEFEVEPAVAQDGESKNQESAPRKRINFENRELEMLVDVNKNATKKGIKIQFLSDEELSKEERTKLVSSLQTYLDEGLAKFVKGAKLNVDSDQDVPNKTKTVGFTIKIGDVFGLVSKVFANRGDDEEEGGEVDFEAEETEETEELQELRRQIRSFLKESFRDDITAAKAMIDAGATEEEVIKKYGVEALNAVNFEAEDYGDDMHDDPGDIRIDHDYYTENLKEDQFVGKDGGLFEIYPEDLAPALEDALTALDLEEVGDIKDKKTLKRLVRMVSKSSYTPKQFSSLNINQQLDILQTAEMYI